MPRPYRLGRRAAPKAEVRERIIAAALSIYAERGLAGASNLSIARAADVAPATVRNHFPEPGDLARAVFEALLAEFRIPTPAIFEGLTTCAIGSSGWPASSRRSTSEASPGGGPTSGSRT